MGIKLKETILRYFRDYWTDAVKKNDPVKFHNSFKPKFCHRTKLMKYYSTNL